jgi:L-lactate dehydrogenase (cytochrome)
MQDHPGGAQIILKYAGGDVTPVYDPIHPPDALDKNLPPSKHLGSLDSHSVLSITQAQAKRQKTKDELRVERAQKQKPPLCRILSLADMEVRLQWFG